MDPRTRARCRRATVAVALSLLFHADSVASAAYRVYAANLHVHSNISGLMRGEADHVTARTPQETVRRSNARELDVIGLSDHDGAIEASDWSFLAWLQDETQRQTGEYAACLRGFEWTYCGVSLDTSTYDHINIFASAALTSADSHLPIDLALQKLHSWLLSRAAERPVAQFNHVWMGTRFQDFSGL
jgi:hypothetical protein